MQCKKNFVKPSKKDVYASFGIAYNGKQIDAPLFGWINPLLINGNAKLGKGVFTWSMTPGTVDQGGTCLCNCPGCYAKSGCYNFPSTKKSLAQKTVLARLYMDFVKRAIIAQIHAEKIQFVRIHAAGDFFNAAYIATWVEIVKACPGCTFWTYTKNPDAENAFNGLDNANIVKSCIAGIGINYGHCGYVMDAYNALTGAGESVCICRCGVDDMQHCNNCKGCSSHKYVLFIEHSTAYKAQLDPIYPAICEIVNSQAQ